MMSSNYEEINIIECWLELYIFFLKRMIQFQTPSHSSTMYSLSYNLVAGYYPIATVCVAVVCLIICILHIVSICTLVIATP